MTTPFYIADTAAAALLSTGLRTGYAPGLWTTGNEDVAARRFMPPAAGQGRKPGPCGLRPVPCLHFSPTAA